MKIVCFMFSLIVGTLALSEEGYQNAFTSWMQVHRRTYNHNEFRFRYQIWKENYDWIEKFNAEGKHTFTVAMNHLGDLSSDEFQRYYTGGLIMRPNDAQPISPLFKDLGDPLPASKDWRNLGAVAKVKDQGQCGSCWSFSTTGAVEGCHQISTGQMVELSEQNLLDCSSSYGNHGCNGGLMTSAFDYIIKNQGVDTEASYPYTARQGVCNFKKENVGATITGYHNVPQGDELALQKAVSLGPVSIGIDASRSSFQFYKSGVYYDSSCSSYQLDHGVLAVGWGTDASGGDYWIVKNSWGSSWGLNGYILMSRNKQNHCGVATMASLPTC